MSESLHRANIVPMLVVVAVLALTFFWAGWSYSENIARISQGEPAPQAKPVKAWSDTLA